MFDFQFRIVEGGEAGKVHTFWASSRRDKERWVSELKPLVATETAYSGRLWIRAGRRPWRLAYCKAVDRTLAVYVVGGCGRGGGGGLPSGDAGASGSGSRNDRAGSPDSDEDTASVRASRAVAARALEDRRGGGGLGGVGSASSAVSIRGRSPDYVLPLVGATAARGHFLESSKNFCFTLSVQDNPILFTFAAPNYSSLLNVCPLPLMGGSVGGNCADWGVRVANPSLAASSLFHPLPPPPFCLFFDARFLAPCRVQWGRILRQCDTRGTDGLKAAWDIPRPALQMRNAPVRGRGVRILCLDGGGARAMFQIGMLQELQNQVSRMNAVFHPLIS